jgi:hypothetical protein
LKFGVASAVVSALPTLALPVDVELCSTLRMLNAEGFEARRPQVVVLFRDWNVETGFGGDGDGVLLLEGDRDLRLALSDSPWGVRDVEDEKEVGPEDAGDDDVLVKLNA